MGQLTVSEAVIPLILQPSVHTAVGASADCRRLGILLLIKKNYFFIASFKKRLPFLSSLFAV